VVSFKPLPLCPRYPLDRRLGGPQNRSGRRREEKNLTPTRTRTPTHTLSSPVASYYTDCTITAPYKICIHRFRTTNLVIGLLVPPRKFTRLPCQHISVRNEGHSFRIEFHKTGHFVEICCGTHTHMNVITYTDIFHVPICL
jgi:hypothetical protein